MIQEMNEMDDIIFETMGEQFITELFPVSEIGELSRRTMEELKSMNYSHEEYAAELSQLHVEFNKTREMIKDTATSEVKRNFILGLLDRVETAVQAVVDTVDYYDVHIQVERCRENAKLPQYAHPWDAGADVYAVEDTLLYGGETKIIPTGLKVNIPKGWMLSVRPRSGLSAKTGLRVSNAPGTIDTGYQSEVGIIITNTSDERFEIHAGDRIAQFVVERRWNAAFDEVADITTVSEVSRANANGADGYGSSGK